MKAGSLPVPTGISLADRELERLAAVCFSGVKMLDRFNRLIEGDAPSVSRPWACQAAFCLACY
jgi:hypothetical protein